MASEQALDMVLAQLQKSEERIINMIFLTGLLSWMIGSLIVIVALLLQTK
jgi:hypothetical protein